jgi:hypothetical protein
MAGSVVGGPVDAPEVVGASEGAMEDARTTEVDGLVIPTVLHFPLRHEP